MASAALADEPVPLTFSSWGDAAEKAILEKALARYTEETGINVEYLYTPEDYVTKMTTMAAARHASPALFCSVRIATNRHGGAGDSYTQVLNPDRAWIVGLLTRALSEI